MSNTQHDEEFQESLNISTIARIIRTTLYRWPLFLSFIIFVIAVSLLEGYATYLTKFIIDDGMLSGNWSVTLSYLRQFIFVMILQAITVFGFIWCAGMLGEQLQYDLRNMIFTHLQKLSLSFFDKTALGWLLARTNSDTSKLADFATWMLLDMFWAVSNMIFALYFMSKIDVRLMFIVFAIIPPLIFIAVKFKKLIIKEYRGVRLANSRLTANYNETITGVRVIKGHAKEKESLQNFSTITHDMYRHSFRATWISALFLPVVQIITSLALGGILWVGGTQLQLGTLTVGSLKAFISYIAFIMWPVSELARVYSEMQHAVAGAERVFSLLDSEPEIVDAKDAKEFSHIKQSIEWKDVHFAYETENPILSNFSFRIEKGETIALVGPTGGGKTTIVNLLCRFYEPTSGSILIDGIDYRQYTSTSYQQKLGIVPQTPHLFTGTIWENIGYGRLDATKEEILHVAKETQVDLFVSHLEKGYDTEVGEGGSLLSVGQKQLIGIARAMLSQPELVIFDEATSSIDTITEQSIQKGMSLLFKHSTAIVIAHRLSTIRDADKIVVIEDGLISEIGTHQELLVRKGPYYRLYTNQFREELKQSSLFH